MVTSRTNISLFTLFFAFLSACSPNSVAISPTTNSWSGIKQLGVIGTGTLAYASATDSQGNVFVGGRVYGGLDGNSLSGSGAEDFFVTKYDSIGSKLWTRQLGCSGATFGNSLVADSTGNVFISGWTMCGLDGNALIGSMDSFITKYNSEGVKQWTKQIGGATFGTDNWSLSTDSTGNIFSCGFTHGNLDGNTLIGGTDFYVTKYNASGIKQWTKTLGVSGSFTYCTSCASDTSGNVFITGTVNAGLDGNSLIGTNDTFITKYNSSGVKQWTKQLGATGAETFGYDLGVDSSGNAIITGFVGAGLDGNTLTGTRDYFITKYNTSGVKQWTQQLGVASVQTTGTSVSIDSADNIFVSGYSYGAFTGNIITGVADLFVSKHNANGVLQ